jgi:hypothetical protein
MFLNRLFCIVTGTTSGGVCEQSTQLAQLERHTVASQTDAHGFDDIVCDFVVDIVVVDNVDVCVVDAHAVDDLGVDVVG